MNKGKKSLPFRCNPENRGLLLVSAAINAVLDPNANPNAKATLAYETCPYEHSSHWEGHSNQSGKCQDSLASGTLQLLPAGNYRGVQKHNFLHLPKLGNALQDPAGVEVNIQKNFDLASCQNFYNLWTKAWHIFRKKKKKKLGLCVTHLFLWSLVLTSANWSLYIFKNTKN